MPSQWIARPAVVCCPRHAKLEVRCRLEAESLPVNNGLWLESPSILADESQRCEHQFIPGILTQEELDPHWSQDPQKARKLERGDTVDPEHDQRIRVVAQHHSAAFIGSPPQALFSE